jgi:hypothetical protein
MKSCEIFCLMNSTIMIVFFSAHVDTMEQTASESTLQETSICARMVT